MSRLADRRIGFIGTGIMGRWMVGHLAAAGATLAIHNRSRAKAEALVRPGIALADSAASAAAGADAVVLMVSDTAAAETVLFGARGVISAAVPALLVIDMGTTAVAATRRFAVELEARGMAFVDAPVSGGEPAAKEGRLIIMAGGRQEAIDRARPLFEVLGRRFTHVGDVGAGQVAKAANQTIVALTIGAVAEALTLARRAGVDPARVREALLGGFAGSKVLEFHGNRMLTGDYKPGFFVRLFQKDLRLANEANMATGVTMPVTSVVTQFVNAYAAAGGGELDCAAAAEVWFALSEGKPIKTA